MKTELLHTLCKVGDIKKASYGGSQMTSPSKSFRASGCGVVAAQELLIYLCRYHGGGGSRKIRELAAQESISEADYNDCAAYLTGKYLPIIPRFGINGISLATGINAYFLFHGMPYTAKWGVTGNGFLGGITEQLSRDIPVIMSIGPGFPKVWDSSVLPLYSKTADGNYIPYTGTRAHYVIAAAIDDEWIRISSWGRRCYINIAEYRSYVAEKSSYIVSNYVIIRKKE